MEEPINLTKILKVGDRVYSTISGHGTVESIDIKTEYPIRVKFDDNTRYNYTKHGFFFFNEEIGECVLFPSKEERDWSKYKPIERRYDFKPFEKVLCRNNRVEKWVAGLFSHYSNDVNDMVVTVGDCYYYYCIPYEGNEHLLGTDKSK